MEKGKSGEWVKSRGPVDSPEVKAQEAKPEDVSAALQLIQGDPVLKEDPWASTVVANSGIVTIEETGEQVAVDLQNFLAARRAILEQDRIRNFDEMAVRVAQSTGFADAGKKPPTMH